jgi:hypothetical protein
LRNGPTTVGPDERSVLGLELSGDLHHLAADAAKGLGGRVGTGANKGDPGCIVAAADGDRAAKGAIELYPLGFGDEACRGLGREGERERGVEGLGDCHRDKVGGLRIKSCEVLEGQDGHASYLRVGMARL